MSRRRREQSLSRKIRPDTIYGSEIVSRFINRMMLDGKKSVAESVFYKAIKIIEEKAGKNGFDVFSEAVEKVKPLIEVRSRRVGGATYQVPVEVYPRRQVSLALRWMVTYTRQRGERGMENKLAGEVMDILNDAGGSMKKREDVFKMAEANKAFSHYRW